MQSAVQTAVGKFGRDKTRSTSPPKARSISPPKNDGRLYVIVVEAKNLHGKEKNDVVSVVSDVTHQLRVGKDFVSQMVSDDPICKITCGKKTNKTSVKIGTLQPKWNEKFVFEGVERTEVVKFVLRDNLTIGKGHFFGEVAIPIANMKKNTETDEWYRLCKRRSITTDVTGSLRLKLLYQPDPHSSLPPGFLPSHSSAISIDSRSHSDSDTPPTGGSPTHDVIHPADDDEDDENSRDSDDGLVEVPIHYTASSPTLPLSFAASQPIAITSNSAFFPEKLPKESTKERADIRESKDKETSPTSSPIIDPLHSNNRPDSPNAQKETSPVDSSSTEDETPVLHHSNSFVGYSKTKTTSLKQQYSMSADDIALLRSGERDVPTPTSPNSVTNKRLRTTSKPFAPSPLGVVSSGEEKAEDDYGSRPDPKRLDFFIRKFNLPPEEKLLKVFSCALHKQLLLHGRLFLSPHYFCFHSNIFGLKTTETIPISEITDIKKNFYNLSLGVQIITATKQYNFASFFSRDKSFSIITRIWKSAQNSPITLGKDEEEEDFGEDQNAEEEEEEDNWESFLSQEDSQGGFLNCTPAEMASIIDEELPVNVMQFFKYFYSDGSFVKLYHEQRGDKEISVKEWSPHAQFGSIRELQYRAPLKQPIGPSSAQCTETQRYHLSKTHLSIESVQVMYDIPYGDYFRVEGKWEVIPGATANSCRVKVWAGVYFMKKTWWKGKIESGAQKESEDSFAMWMQLARKEISRQSMDREKRMSVDHTNLKRQSLSEGSVPVAAPLPQPVSPPPKRRISISILNKVIEVAKKGSVDLTAAIKALFVFLVVWIYLALTSTDSTPFLLLFVLALLSYRVLSLENRLSTLEEKKKDS